MIEEQTLRPQQQQLNLQASLEQPEEEQQPLQQMAQQAQYAGAVVCPNCGAMNEPEAQFCASCGSPLHGQECPNCGSPIEADADFCEVCHRYIRNDVCPFCGGHIGSQDGYCPECGSPHGSIVCPTCHTLNDFSFCKQCGQPLTEEARAIVSQLREKPEYRALTALAREFNELEMELPYTSAREKQRDDELQQFREHVLKLLAQDAGVAIPEGLAAVVTIVLSIGMTKMAESNVFAMNARPQQVTVSLAISSKFKVEDIEDLYAGMRLAWLCNYKNALHSSPCGCAKPQLGGKWVILGHNSTQEIKDDK